MKNNINWANPYAERDGQWLKGNLHTHTSPASGCGEISIEDCVDLYVKHGYDFLSISDHCAYTDHIDDRLTLIPGVEWNSPTGCHTGVYSLDTSHIHAAIAVHDQELLLNNLANTGALVILNHPNWQMRPHYRREELDAKHDYDGIEIYNAVIERLEGYSISTDKWDYLLTRGTRILGFANDDSHRAADIGHAAIYVRCKTRAAADILAAIKTGNFYSSSGVVIEDIRCQDGIIEIETPDAQQIEARVDGGQLVQRVMDKSIRLDTCDIKRAYVRFVIYGNGSAMAWTQPFFLG